MAIKHSLPLPLRIGAPLLVTLILAFVLLPVVVVTVASFNDKALLTFPLKPGRCAGSNACSPIQTSSRVSVPA